MGHADLRNKIDGKKAKLCVIGLGYVGLPLAVEFAKTGFSVVGIDTDLDRINNINNSIPYILDVSLAEINKVVKNKKLYATADFEFLEKADAVIICVPTPLKKKDQPDISYILSALKQISKHLHKDQLIVLESTTYPGTTEEVMLPILEKKGLVCGKDFYLAFSPERIDPGNLKYPFRKIPKIVGGIDSNATDLVKRLYSKVIVKVVPVSSARVAETAKLLENTFRLINIGFINELAMMCEKMKIDIWEVIEAANTKPFGFMPFYPGPGVGGHCIPDDPLYLYWKARHHGFICKFIKLASDTNSSMPRYIVERVRGILSRSGISLEKAKILVLGVTYKKDIKDLRKSPAINIIDILQKEAGLVKYSDPLIPYLKINSIDLKSHELKTGFLSGFDFVILVTDHSVFNYDMIRKKAKNIFDVRNVYKDFKSKNIFKL
ncbi:MAG: UDP-N-acetyl-D-glucosamine dehydrogenase [Candidatus Omnitrophica bacterium CG11_big_fil_rev_8_21_14_0_20_42_13]|uniref:UDP-N-acetyl-D-glucosamine dehydrogenase n=1 Tax=Candidatus Ghiorseimicrobium undicola TaxID=1974746 RepID=A0A2H0M113_9BACT|nr:MAG: UDP-N-acetyl-D-glucosamine dehydrogenase [Candidatus Omnitrophica bacterium CG11_big_fil_rev_8_21_14_0_20_42_13]